MECLTQTSHLGRVPEHYVPFKYNYDPAGCGHATLGLGFSLRTLDFFLRQDSQAAVMAVLFRRGTGSGYSGAVLPLGSSGRSDRFCVGDEEDMVADGQGHDRFSGAETSP